MFLKTICLVTLLTVLIGFFNCTGDPPEPTGLFDISFSGNITDQLQGVATFELDPRNTFGLINVNLVQSQTEYFRLSFFNPSPSQIVLEPGTYTVVEQLGSNVPGEVLVDYIDESGTFNAASGELRVGIVKQTQIKGDLVNVRFNLLNSSCNGRFDAIPE